MSECDSGSETPGLESFTEFVTANRPSLVAAAAAACGDAQYAEDIVQEALIKVAVRWRKLQEERPEAYCRRIIFNAAVSHWRQLRRRVRADGLAALSDRHGDRHATADPASELVDHAMLLELLRQLSARQRAVLYLRYVDDLSERSVADMLGISVGAVKKHAHLGLSRLRALYDRREREQEIHSDSTKA